ncbi:yfiH Multicopper polyphenol oxidase (laccase) [Candidatus Methylopumilus universalis]|uniref:peptidoglycan editing factor PgeF n=1 Tax=Candidatus Methylopumilus universalis TaxID=2588536 RepID=UPI003BEF38E8
MSNFFIPDWPVPLHIKSMQTLRAGGQSQDKYNSFNLATHVNDEINTVHLNRDLLNQYLPSSPYWLNQTHSVDVLKLPSLTINGDASYTTEKNTVCVVQTADCLPLLVTNMDGTIVAAIHAGWRGLLNGVIENTIEKMNISPNELLVWLGPAISQKHFEVGFDVKNSYCEKHTAAEKAFHLISEQKWLADIYALAKIRLHICGISQIYGGSVSDDYCTFANEVDYFSYRRDGVTGRMASLIWIDS